MRQPSLQIQGIAALTGAVKGASPRHGESAGTETAGRPRLDRPANPVTSSASIRRATRFGGGENPYNLLELNDFIKPREAVLKAWSSLSATETAAERSVAAPVSESGGATATPQALALSVLQDLY